MKTTLLSLLFLLTGAEILFAQNLVIKNLQSGIKGSITYSVTSNDSGFTVNYNSKKSGAEINISALMDAALPSDYNVSFVLSSAKDISLRTYLRNSDSTLFKGSRLVHHKSKNKAKTYILSRAVFLRPDSTKQNYPLSISEFSFVFFIKHTGKGSVSVKNITVEEKYLDSRRVLMPVMTLRNGEDIAPLLLDADSSTYHKFTAGISTVAMNFHMPSNPSGFFLLTDSLTSPLNIEVYAGKEKNLKNLLGSIVCTGRKKVFLPIEEHETAEYFFVFNTQSGFSLKEIELLPGLLRNSPELFYTYISRYYAPGLFPTGYSNVAPSVHPIPGTEKYNVLINTDGNIELAQSNTSIVQYLRIYDEFGTALNAAKSLRFAPDTSSVVHMNLAYTYGEVWIHAFCDTVQRVPYLNLIYEIRNTYHFKIKGKLHLAFLPVRLNPFHPASPELAPPFQVKEFAVSDDKLKIDRTQEVLLFTSPQTAGVFSLYNYDIFDAITAERIDAGKQLKDKTGNAAALLAYDFTLIPGARRLIHLSLPLSPAGQKTIPAELRNLETRMKKLTRIQ